MPHWTAPLPLVGPVSGPPQWIEPIADDVVSGVATYDLVWTGDYAAVRIDVHDMVPVTNSIAQIRTTSDGGATFAATAGDYHLQAMTVSANATQQFTQNASAANMALHAGASQVNSVASAQGYSGKITILRPFDAAYTAIHGYGGYYGVTGPGMAICEFFGMRKAPARVDGVRLYFSTGNIASARFRSRGIIGYGEAA